MARTDKWEHSTPDPIRVIWKMERKARPAGRLLALVAAELEAEGEG